MKSYKLPEFKTREQARKFLKRAKAFDVGSTLIVGDKQSDGVWPIKFKGGTLSLPQQAQ
jgi:hypothetical protein